MSQNKAPTNHGEIELDPAHLPEVRKQNNCCLTAILNNNQNIEDILKRFSNYNKLVRVIAYVMRWKHKVINKQIRVTHTKSLSVEELDNSIEIIIRLSQKVPFGKEIHSLKIDNHVNSDSKIFSLNPFLDETGILRVGGRLHNTNF